MHLLVPYEIRQNIGQAVRNLHLGTDFRSPYVIEVFNVVIEVV